MDIIFDLLDFTLETSFRIISLRKNRDNSTDVVIDWF